MQWVVYYIEIEESSKRNGHLHGMNQPGKMVIKYVESELSWSGTSETNYVGLKLDYEE